MLFSFFYRTAVRHIHSSYFRLMLQVPGHSPNFAERSGRARERPITGIRERAALATAMRPLHTNLRCLIYVRSTELSESKGLSLSRFTIKKAQGTTTTTCIYTPNIYTCAPLYA